MASYAIPSWNLDDGHLHRVSFLESHKKELVWPTVVVSYILPGFSRYFLGSVAERSRSCPIARLGCIHWELHSMDVDYPLSANGFGLIQDSDLGSELLWVA